MPKIPEMLSGRYASRRRAEVAINAGLPSPEVSFESSRG